MGTYGAGQAFMKRFEQRSTYVPRGHVNCRPPAQQPVKVEIRQEWHAPMLMPEQPKTNWWAVGVGMLFGFADKYLDGKQQQASPYAQLNQAQMPQQQGNVNYLSNLKTMYPDFNIVDDGNGQFRATDKSGNSYGPADYNTMCELLGNAEKNTPTVDNQNPDTVEEEDEPDGKKTPGEETPAENDGKGGKENPVSTSHRPTNANKAQSGGNGKVNSNTGVANSNKTEWTAAKKKDPVNVTIQFSIHSNSTNSGTATVKMPDGTVFTVTTGPSLSHNRAMNALANDMREKLKAAGWTNVTLVNPNFKFSQSPKSDSTSSTSGTQGTGNTQGAQEKQWTAAEKAKPITLKINFSIHTMLRNNGTATVTTPDGQTYTVSTGFSRTHQRAMEALSKQMKQQLTNAGWTNVTLTNQNFNWQD